MKKKPVSLILAVLMLLLTLQPAAVLAQTDATVGEATPSASVASATTQPEASTQMREYPIGVIDVDYTPPSYTPRSLMRMAANNLPSSYVTPNLPVARDQGGYGTCWAHAMLQATEINMIKQGLATSDINLSELQFIWFHHMGARKADGTYNDPLNNFSGDRNIYTNNLDGGVWGGDNVLFAAKSLASWMGPAREDSTTAYSNAANVASTGLGYEYAFGRDAAHLSGVRAISMENKDAVKQAIVKYGAVVIDYAHVDSKYKNKIYYYYYPNTGSMPAADHSVTIIGWDDTIPASSFNAGPQANGAWLVRNSWGRYADIGRNSDGNFYISYESAYVSSASDVAWAFEVAPLGESDYCYQYDGTCSRGSISVDTGETRTPKAANIFTAQRGETIRAVSFWLDNEAGVPYTVDVYTGVTPDAPVSGTKAATVSGTTEYAGYYTVKLPAPVLVAAGTKFSVVVTFTNSGTSSFELPIDANGSNGSVSEILIEMKSFSLPRQSFVYLDDDSVYGGWRDMGTSGNCRIKAFTKEAPITNIAVSAATNVMYAGHDYPLSVAITPPNATNKSVSWSITSGADVARVNENGVLTTLKTGAVTVRATAKDGSGVYGEKTFNISAGDRTLVGIEITKLPNKTVYFKRDAFESAGLVVSAVYDDSTKQDVTAQAALTGFDSSKLEASVVTAQYGGYTATFKTYTFGGVGMSLSLEGTIAINLEAVFPEFTAAGYTPGLLAFSAMPTQAQIEAAYAAGRGLAPSSTSGSDVLFKYSNIAAKQMSDNVYVVLYAASNTGRVTYGKTTSLSVVYFVNEVFRQYKDDASKRQLLTMLVDMLDYGAQAQLYFNNYHIDALANAGVTAEQRAFASTAPLMFSSVGQRYSDRFSSPATDVNVTSISLTLESEISINFYAEMGGTVRAAKLLIFDDYVPNSGRSYYHGSTLKRMPMTLQTSGSDAGRYMGSIPNIIAKAMRTPYYARVYAELTDGRTVYSDVLRYDVESYAGTVRNRDKYATQRSLTEAMMRYGDSAIAYFATR